MVEVDGNAPSHAQIAEWLIESRGIDAAQCDYRYATSKSPAATAAAPAGTRPTLLLLGLVLLVLLLLLHSALPPWPMLHTVTTVNQIPDTPSLFESPTQSIDPILDLHSSHQFTHLCPCYLIHYWTLRIIHNIYESRVRRVVH